MALNGRRYNANGIGAAGVNIKQVHSHPFIFRRSWLDKSHPTGSTKLIRHFDDGGFCGQSGLSRIS